MRPTPQIGTRFTFKRFSAEVVFACIRKKMSSALQSALYYIVNGNASARYRKNDHMKGKDDEEMWDR